MIEFKKPELADKEQTGKIMKLSGEKGCEYCFGNLFMWSAVYGNTIALYNGLFLCRGGEERPLYLFPCGRGDKKAAIEELMKYSEERQEEHFHIYGLTEETARELDEMFPGKFTFKARRDFSDYIYKASDLAELSGKKYHAKRNHISYFKKNNSWSFEEINSANMEECIDMNRRWEKLYLEKNPEELKNEETAIMRAFENFDALGLRGALIRAGGQVVAYTVGEEINSDVFCTHIEKAYADVRGAYPVINQEFAKLLSQKYKYINREEDVGSEGLRKAKLSYYPEILLDKYTAMYEG